MLQTPDENLLSSLELIVLEAVARTEYHEGQLEGPMVCNL